MLRKAALPDIESISRIQAENACPDGPTTNEQSDKGFLVHIALPDELRLIIENEKRHLFRVFEQQNEVVGYCLGYALEEWTEQKKEWLENVEIKSDVWQILHEQKALYLRHIALHPEYAKQGLGKEMECQYWREAALAGYRFILGEILEAPKPNQRSLHIHRDKLGMTRIGHNAEAEKIWGIYMKELS